MNAKNEVIELSLPANAAYVSAARLTASSIANRLDFDIDETEDVKAAVSEACTFVIKKASTDYVDLFKVAFEPGENLLTVRIRIGKIDLTPDDGDMSLMMIRALTDEFVITERDDEIEIRMVKKHQEIFL